MTVAKTRRHLYTAARVLGDVQAARRGRLWQRLANVLIGRAAGRALREVWR